MRNIRYTILGLILVLAFIYNIERLDTDVPNVINLQTYVYILVTVLVIVPIAYPKIINLGVFYGLVGWLAIYFIIKIVFYPENIPYFGSGNIYLMVTELSLIFMTYVVSYQLTNYVKDIETTLETMMLFGVQKQIKELHKSEDFIKSEFYIGRRYNIPLSLLALELDDESVAVVFSKTIQEMQKRLSNRYAILHLTKVLRNHLRGSDNLLVDLENQRLCVLSFGTDSTGIKKLREKVMNISENELEVKIFSGLASFPEDAQTFEGLLEKSLEHIKEH
ncbi:MAG: hypothetical protein GWN62_12165 [Aliifodinibius sp.]|nr:hypothetical protein [Fodinibius sp.]